MEKKTFIKSFLRTCLLLFFVFLIPLLSQAGEFSYEDEWGIMCRALFGCNRAKPYGFWGATSIEVNSYSEKIYVGDLLNARVHKYTIDGDADGMLTECFDENANTFDYCIDEGESNYTPSIAVSPLGDYVYVSDPRNMRINKYDTSIDPGESGHDNWVLSWGLFEEIPWIFSEPSNIAVDEVGDVYVTDILGSSVVKFDQNGNYLTTWLHPDYLSGDDYRPAGITVASSGIYVVDYLNSYVYQFDYSGEIINSWGGYDGTEVGEFTYPADIAIDSEGHVFVVDTLNDRIQEINGSGTVYSGTEEGTFKKPFGIAVDVDGFIYVADTFNNRFIKYSFSDL